MGFYRNKVSRRSFLFGLFALCAGVPNLPLHFRPERKIFIMLDGHEIAKMVVARMPEFVRVGRKSGHLY